MEARITWQDHIDATRICLERIAPNGVDGAAHGDTSAVGTQEGNTLERDIRRLQRSRITDQCHLSPNACHIDIPRVGLESQVAPGGYRHIEIRLAGRTKIERVYAVVTDLNGDGIAALAITHLEIIGARLKTVSFFRCEDRHGVTSSRMHTDKAIIIRHNKSWLHSSSEIESVSLRRNAYLGWIEQANRDSKSSNKQDDEHNEYDDAPCAKAARPLVSTNFSILICFFMYDIFH